MANKKIVANLKQKVDTSENWQTLNPVLLDGEIGFEKQNNKEVKQKVGDGVTNWNLLPYTSLVPSEIEKSYVNINGDTMTGPLKIEYNIVDMPEDFQFPVALECTYNIVEEEGPVSLTTKIQDSISCEYQINDKLLCTAIYDYNGITLNDFEATYRFKNYIDFSGMSVYNEDSPDLFYTSYSFYGTVFNKLVNGRYQTYGFRQDQNTGNLELSAYPETGQILMQSLVDFSNNNIIGVPAPISGTSPINNSLFTKTINAITNGTTVLPYLKSSGGTLSGDVISAGSSNKTTLRSSGLNISSTDLSSLDDASLSIDGLQIRKDDRFAFYQNSGLLLINQNGNNSSPGGFVRLNVTDDKSALLSFGALGVTDRVFDIIAPKIRIGLASSSSNPTRAGNIQLDGVATPTTSNQAANKEYVDTAISNIPPPAIPIATNSVVGGIKIGSNITISEDGTASVTNITNEGVTIFESTSAPLVLGGSQVIINSAIRIDKDMPSEGYFGDLRIGGEAHLAFSNLSDSNEVRIGKLGGYPNGIAFSNTETTYNGVVIAGLADPPLGSSPATKTYVDNALSSISGTTYSFKPSYFSYKNPGETLFNDVSIPSAYSQGSILILSNMIFIRWYCSLSTSITMKANTVLTFSISNTIRLPSYGSGVANGYIGLDSSYNKANPEMGNLSGYVTAVAGGSNRIIMILDKDVNSIGNIGFSAICNIL